MKLKYSLMFLSKKTEKLIYKTFRNEYIPHIVPHIAMMAKEIKFPRNFIEALLK